MGFGRFLKKAMKLKGVTQDELADGIDKKQATISGYVTNKIDPSFKTIESISVFLEMPLSDLVKEEEDDK